MVNKYVKKKKLPKNTRLPESRMNNDNSDLQFDKVALDDFHKKLRPEAKGTLDLNNNTYIISDDFSITRSKFLESQRNISLEPIVDAEKT